MNVNDSIRRSKATQSSYLVLCISLVVAFSNNAIAAIRYNCIVNKVISHSFSVEKPPKTFETETNISDGSTSILYDWMKSASQLEADYAAKLYVGKKFWIDIQTGHVNGDFSSESFATHEVLNKGDSDWSFKVLIGGYSNDAGHKHSMYIEVMQYSTLAQKPFLGLGMAGDSTSLLGNCLLGY